MSDITVEVGTQFRFIAASGFSPADPATDYTIGTPTDVLLTLSGVADDAARQSSKADLGANRAARHGCVIAADFTDETPAATGGQVEAWWAPSHSVTPANANVAGNSGVDAACPDGALGGITLDEFLAQCVWIGALRTHDGASVQVGEVGVLKSRTQFGQIILVDRAGDVFEADNVEMAVWLTEMRGDVA